MGGYRARAVDAAHARDPAFVHIYPRSSDEFRLAPDAEAAARGDWLCGACSTVRVDRAPRGVRVRPGPRGRNPLNALSGCGLGVASRRLIEVIDRQVVERDLIVGPILDVDGDPLDPWIWFHGSPRLVVRAEKNLSYRICPECGALHYYATGRRHLFPPPPSSADLFVSDHAGLVLRRPALEASIEHLLRDFRRVCCVEDLPVPSAPLDGMTLPGPGVPASRLADIPQAVSAPARAVGPTSPISGPPPPPRPEVGAVEEAGAQLETVGSFFLDLYPHYPSRDEQAERLPPHPLVLEPLLAHALEVRVYGCPKTGPLRENIAPVARPRSGYLELDASAPLVRGHEAFWNAGAWERGSVGVVCAIDPPALAEVFSHCSGPRIWASAGQLEKGNVAGAVRFCRKAGGQAGRVAFLFSASNGMQRMDVFAPDGVLRELYALAEVRCRPSNRPGESDLGRDEIIVDRPPDHRVD